MPPVLGPWSPSRSRLWSWLVASGSTCTPSLMTMKLAHDARGERRFRAHHGEMDVLLFCKGDQRRDFGDGDVLEARLERRAAVAGSDEDLLHPHVLGELPRERVLAPSRSDDEELHV